MATKAVMTLPVSRPSYTVEETEFGVLVRGVSIPADDLAALEKAWKRRGMTQLVTGVASALGALLAVASEENGLRWLEAVKHDAEKKAAGDRELAWLEGPDTGISSLTLFAALSREHGEAAAARLRSFYPDVPHDPDDFGRCYRVLRAIPGWRARIGEVAARFPAWAGLVEAWGELERLYEEEIVNGSGRAPKLWARMQAIAKARRAEPVR